jgi:hypothetical protein
MVEKSGTLEFIWFGNCYLVAKILKIAIMHLTFFAQIGEANYIIAIGLHLKNNC